MQKILSEHFARYPRMLPQDAVKLCYQSTFGGGHMIAGRQTALARLREEQQNTPKADRPLFEEIGGGLVRLYINAPEADMLLPETINGLFCETAREMRGSTDKMLAKCELLRTLAREGKTPFSAESLEEFLTWYTAQGCPAVRHTPLYRELYSPAYRLVSKNACLFLPVLQAMDTRLRDAGTVRLAIDGMSGAGKSTAGAWLAYVYESQFFHMDDYFLPAERKTPERLREPGGNADYERFAAEIASVPIACPVRYAPYSCAEGRICAYREIKPNRVRITEGSYALHPRLRPFYDLSVYMSVSAGEQERRIRLRSGEMLPRFLNEWIPLENTYEKAFGIAQSADFRIDGEQLIP